MKKTWAMKWAKALESGKYKQATSGLRIGEGYCCLGVLCKIAGKRFYKIDTIDTAGKQLNYYYTTDTVYHTNERNYVPTDVMELTGLKSAAGVYPGLHGSESGYKGILSDAFPELQNSLARLNDYLKYDFTQIAQVIRDNWRDL